MNLTDMEHETRIEPIVAHGHLILGSCEVVPTSEKSWLIKAMVSIDRSPINHSYWSYKML